MYNNLGNKIINKHVKGLQDFLQTFCKKSYIFRPDENSAEIFAKNISYLNNKNELYFILIIKTPKLATKTHNI